MARTFFHHLRQNPLRILLLCFPLALIAVWAQWGAGWIFSLSALGVIPLASYIGDATEELAAFTGPKIGGLINATLGNAAELIITLTAIRAGLLDLVKASITGSILGNLLLVLGFAMLAGGLKNGIQTFNRRQSGNNAILLTLVVLALVIPSIFSQSIGPQSDIRIEEMSLGVAVIMIVLYVLGLVFSLKYNHTAITYPAPAQHGSHPKKQWANALVVLALATGGVVWMSELLVGAVDAVVIHWGLSEFFLGIILIPIVGNTAEHMVAVQVAIRNQMELSVEVAVSSSLQVALFVAPVLVFVSLGMGHPLNLVFNTFELTALGAGVLIAALVSADGESSWLEGAALLGVYLILSLAFFMLPK
jgi:Ca2+:H+ antiporter